MLRGPTLHVGNTQLEGTKIDVNVSIEGITSISRAGGYGLYILSSNLTMAQKGENTFSLLT